MALYWNKGELTILDYEVSIRVSKILGRPYAGEPCCCSCGSFYWYENGEIKTHIYSGESKPNPVPIDFEVTDMTTVDGVVCCMNHEYVALVIVFGAEVTKFRKPIPGAECIPVLHNIGLAADKDTDDGIICYVLCNDKFFALTKNKNEEIQNGGETCKNILWEYHGRQTFTLKWENQSLTITGVLSELRSKIINGVTIYKLNTRRSLIFDRKSRPITLRETFDSITDVFVQRYYYDLVIADELYVMGKDELKPVKFQPPPSTRTKSARF